VLLCKPDQLPKSPGCVLIFGISARYLNYVPWPVTTSSQKMRFYVSQIVETGIRFSNALFQTNAQCLL